MKEKLSVEYVALTELKLTDYNPRTWRAEQLAQLKESITRFGVCDPLICNGAPSRKNVVIGGHMRLAAITELGHDTAPVVYVHIDDLEKERELNIRLNKNGGEFDLELLAKFDESILSDIGFSSSELDELFLDDVDRPETFDINKELKKLDIHGIEIQKGDVYEFSDGSRLMCGDSTIEADMLTLAGAHQMNMILTDPPYRLSYLKGKTRNGKATEGFGLKRNRKYLETDELPADFTELWMTNAAKVQAKHCSILCYENWKNIREIWDCMEVHWKVRNMIVWHLPNRVQNFAAKYKLFNKHDIAMVGTTPDFAIPNLEAEPDELLENEYQTALFATCGSPHWEPYQKGSRYCPTDFIQYIAADEKSSGQGIIFGTKPTEILVPYIKILTKRDELVLEPFGGSGSTGIASMKLKRRCFTMEKVPTYAEVIRKRWETFLGTKARKIN